LSTRTNKKTLYITHSHSICITHKVTRL